MRNAPWKTEALTVDLGTEVLMAYAIGWNTDELAIDYAAEQMGEEYRTLIGRVHAREFNTYTAN